LFSGILSVILLLFSCGKDDAPIVDDNDADDLPQNETWVVFNGNADWSGGIYALKGNKSRKISLSGILFYQLGYSAGGRVAAGTLYKLNGATSADLGIPKFAIDGSQAVTHAGFLAAPTNTYETNTLIVSSTDEHHPPARRRSKTPTERKKIRKTQKVPNP